MDLAAWFQEKAAAIPTRSNSRFKPARLRHGSLHLPDRLESSLIRGAPYSRSPGSGAISIEAMVFTANRDEFRALGLVFIAFALSDQTNEFRLKLADIDGEIAELIIWPSERSMLEKELGFVGRLHEVDYSPVLPEGNPNYTTTEQDKREEDYPREHLPYCRTGALDVEAGGILRLGEPIGAHFRGTAASLVWMGRYLLNLVLEDSNSRLAYLYNTNPAESLRWRSAELRFTVCDPSEGPRMSPAGSD